MYAIVLLLLVAVLSLLITRIATVALTVTGMPKESARFQARSALTGSGFTTSESEAVVSHPVRRRIVMGLMLIGSAGLVTAVAGLLSGFMAAAREEQQFARGAMLVAGLLLVYLVSRSERVDRHLSHLITKILRRYTDLEVRDYARLLHLAGEYSVKEIAVAPGDWMAGRSLGDLRMKDEGVLVLGVVDQSGEYHGAPGKDTVLHAGDSVVLYGRDTVLAEIDQRPAAADPSPRWQTAGPDRRRPEG
ncbi:MAG TPA: TrkA C-terminal domain-containing protein [Acidimicrobiia bacterium]|nr:TrkA C-terminal domain-containing protein [Acidimicrobiia bacterium]